MKNGKAVKDRRIPDKPAKDLRRVTPDEAVLNLLRRGSADLSKERLIRFYFYFPIRKTARTALGKLQELGFSAECIERSGKAGWLCLVSKEVVPRLAELIRLHRLLDRIAEQLGGEYDGWETELSNDEARGMPGVD